MGFMFFSCCLLLLSCLNGKVWCQSVQSMAQAFRMPILVNQSQSVALTKNNLNLERALKAQVCRIEQDTNQPLSGIVGFLEPKKFDCNYEEGSVFYHHEGSPLSKSDKLVLFIYYIRNESASITEVITLDVKINLNSQSKILSKKGELIVKTWKSLSNTINSNILQFNYDPESELCLVSYDSQRKLNAKDRNPSLATRRWPQIGQIVLHNKTLIDRFESDCQKFLIMGYRYMHRRYTSPDYDFIPLHIRIFNYGGNLLRQERHYLKVNILNSEDNKAPQISIPRSINFTTYGGVLSYLPKDSISVSKDESKERFLSVSIDSIYCADNAAQFVNLRDSSRKISSFTIKDLRDGLIAFEMLQKVNRDVTVFTVTLRVMDSHFSWSSRVQMKINCQRVSGRTFYFYTLPLTTFTRSSAILGVHNIQLAGTVDRPIDTLRYEILPIAEGSTRSGREGHILYNDRTLALSRRMQITNDSLRNYKFSYKHEGGLMESDSVKFLAHFSGTKTFLEMPVHIVRLFSLTDYPLLLGGASVSVTQNGVVCLKPEDILNSTVLFYVNQDGENIQFSIMIPPTDGYVIKRFPTFIDPSAPRPKQLSQFSLKELETGAICYINLMRSRPQDSVTIEQMYRNKTASLTLSVYIKPRPDNYLMPKMNSKVTLNIKETESHKVITPDFLNFENFALKPSNILYKFTEYPRYFKAMKTHDAGRFVSLKSLEDNVYKGDTELSSQVRDLRKAEINTVEYFTQEQINSGDIVYVPPLEDIGHENRLVVARYSVSDSYGAQFQNQTIRILVLAEDNQAPILQPGNISVPRDEQIVLSQEHIGAFDADTLIKNLILEITAIPQEGYLVNSPNRKLQVGSRFMVQNLINGEIRYVNKGKNVKFDSFNLTVSDNRRVSPNYQFKINITKRILDANQWNLYVNNSVMVNENSSVTLHRSIFQKSLDSSPNKLRKTYIIVLEPTHGEIIRLPREIKINRFSLEDVAQGRIVYKAFQNEIGSKQVYDIAKLWAPPAGFMDLNFTILPINSQTPVLIKGMPLQVSESETVTLNSYTLTVRDDDTNINKIVINIVQPPLRGNIRVKNQSFVRNFTMKELRNEQVEYINSKNSNGNEYKSDMFVIIAFDGEFYSEAVNLKVGIHPVNDEKPNLYLKDVSIDIGQSIVLTPSYFKVSDLDIPEDILQIQFTQLPKLGYLYMHWKHGEIQVVNSMSSALTQKYLTMMDIYYQHNSTLTKSSARDSFNVSVFDGLHTVTGRCNIRIIGKNTHRPTIVTNTIGLNDKAFVQLSENELKARDQDTSDEDLVFSLLVIPSLGQLELVTPDQLRVINDDSENVEIFGKPIMKDQSFSMKEIKAGKIIYRYTASKRFPTKDTMVLELSDGKFNLPNIYVDVAIAPLKVKPISLKVSTKEASVELGGKVVITTENIIISNINKVSKGQVSIVLVQQLLCGSFIHVTDPLMARTTFTYEDLYQRSILFLAEGCPDALTQMKVNFDVIYSGKQYPIALLIRLRPRPKQMPVVIRCRDMIALQNSETILTSDVLLTKDVDTSADGIVYTLTDTANSLGEIRKNGRPVKRFSQEDVNQGRIIFRSFNSSKTVPSTIVKEDYFYLNVTDGYHKHYVWKEMRHQSPLKLKVILKSVSYQDLNLVVNPPDEIKIIGGFNGFLFTSRHLNLPYPQAIYNITKSPKVGYLYNKKTKTVAATFSQSDINEERIVFLLDEIGSSNLTEDSFEFRVLILQKENVRISSETKRMNISWSRIKFPMARIDLCPRSGILRIPIIRTGRVDVRVKVVIALESMEAKENIDFALYSGKIVIFIPGETVKNMSITVMMGNQTLPQVKRFRVNILQAYGALMNERHHVTVSVRSRRECLNNKSSISPYFTEEKPKSIYTKLKQNTRLEDTQDDSPTSSMLHDEKASVPVVHQPVNPSSSNVNIFQSFEWKLPENLPSDEELDRRYKKYLENKKKIEVEQSPKHSCQLGWRFYLSRCYRLFNSQSTWQQARRICESNSGFLATINDAKISEWIMKNLYPKRSFWIGLYKPDRHTQWIWHNGESVNYFNWDKNFPKGMGLKKRCTFVSRRFKWRNRSCKGKKRKTSFVCMKNPTIRMKS